MMNLVTLVGRIIDFENQKNKTIIEIKVPRNYKNKEGIYEDDYIQICLYDSISENFKNYCNKGDLIGIKGSIRSQKDKSIEIVADKITFLSSKVNNDKVE